MKLILRENVANLGHLGDEVSVKPGYARNFLIPQGLAYPITESNAKEIAHRRKIIDQKRQEQIELSQSLSKKLEELELSFTAKSGGKGKLFGSITTKQILEELKKHSLDLPAHALPSLALKEAGVHKIPVKLHSQVQGELKIKIIEDSPPQKQTSTEDSKDSEEASKE